MAYAYEINSDDVVLRDIHLQSVDYGIRYNYDVDGGYIYHCRGFPKKIGIYADYVTDVAVMEDIFFHPRHRDPNEPWTLHRDGTALWLKEIHNPSIRNFFCFGYRTGLIISGKSQKVNLNPFGADICKYGVIINGNGAEIASDYIYTYGKDNAQGEIGFWIYGNNNVIKITQLEIDAFGKNGIRIDGNNNVVWIGQLDVKNASLHPGDWPAIEVAQGNRVVVENIITNVNIPAETWHRGLGEPTLKVGSVVTL